MSEFQIKEQISLPDRFSITADAEEARNDLALTAARLNSVTNPAEQELAANAMRAIKKYISAVHDGRMGITRNFDDATARLIRLERDHTSPLTEHLDRLERFLTAFDQSQKDRVAAEQKAREQGIATAEAELKEKLEQARAAQEQATDEAGLNRAITAEIGCHEALAALHGKIVAPLPTVSRIKGAFTKPDLQWTCHDVHALYAARPDLCRVEPNAAAIRASCVPEMPIPGLRCWWVDRTTVRR